jgi:O-antigen ligase
MEALIVYFFAPFAVAFASWGGDKWWPNWFVLEYLLAASLGYVIAKRYHWICGLCVTWPLITAINVFGDQSVIIGMAGGQVLAIENVALKAAFSWAVLVGGMAFLKPNVQESLVTVLPVLCFVDSVYVVAQHFMGYYPGGFMGNASMNASFIAVTFAYLAFQPEPIEYAYKALTDLMKTDYLQIFLDIIFVLVPLQAIYFSGSSIPVGTMAMVCGSYLLFSKGKKYFFLASAVMCSFFITGMIFIPDFLASSGRFGMWKAAATWWWKNGDIFKGMGIGTFFLIGPQVQVENKLGINNWWIWCHNDYLQTLIEQGFVGFIILMILVGLTIYKSYKKQKPHETAALVGFASMAFFNFPAHNALCAMVGVLLVARTFDRERSSD